MTICQEAVDLIKEFEGFRAEAYRDAAGVWTIGYGTTAKAGVGIEPSQGMVITKAEAEEYLRLAVDKFAAQIAPMITAPINEHQFGAFVSLAYNIGPSAFRRSSALDEFNDGQVGRAADAILLWNKAGGKVLRGLERRRAAERALFLKPVIDQAEAPQPRTSVAQSTTMQASAVQVASGAGAAVAAVGALDGTAQIVALAFAGVVMLAAAWIMRERLRKWAQGDR
jgi:lysozyme